MKNKIFKIVEIIKLRKMFPNLPTDNLYKFFFVGFLFLIGLIVYTENKENSLLTESYDKYFIENVRQDIQYKTLKADYDKINNDIDYWKRQGSGVYIKKKDSLKNLISLYSKKLKVFEENDSVLSENLKSANEKKIEFDKQKYLNKWYVGILGFLALLSGALWFFRLQIYQDRILKEDLRIKKQS
ncbi:MULTISPECIES: hypothetical protein [Sphingobacterium]|uniref:hypothetical protein n=1 Tax=Sphingobacterium TaxID=28453 RepID=UPI00257CFD9B|nr:MULTISPECIES: hypothetical protein [Sphingobacterium]